MTNNYDPENKMNAAATKVTPQIPSDRQLAGLIAIAADSVDALRRPDVERVITEAPVHFRLALAQHIKAKRRDLIAEVDEVLLDITDQQARAALFIPEITN